VNTVKRRNGYFQVRFWDEEQGEVEDFTLHKKVLFKTREAAADWARSPN
jgi:hypothetical protein